MSNATASVRELRLNFRGVERKVEEYGSVTITNNGNPVYLLTTLPKTVSPKSPMPDYWARLQKQRARPLTRAESVALTRENRGDR
jgi:antitoxin (DNA-binding transcriptional repressor) of toxin-antitoxin stability system